MGSKRLSALYLRGVIFTEIHHRFVFVSQEISADCAKSGANSVVSRSCSILCLTSVCVCRKLPTGRKNVLSGKNSCLIFVVVAVEKRRNEKLLVC